MALGVLNNLSAIYAENNLNNTSNSLQNVLRQLSSGSRINSGADDADTLNTHRVLPSPTFANCGRMWATRRAHECIRTSLDRFG